MNYVWLVVVAGASHSLGSMPLPSGRWQGCREYRMATTAGRNLDYKRQCKHHEAEYAIQKQINANAEKTKQAKLVVSHDAVQQNEDANSNYGCAFCRICYLSEKWPGDHQQAYNVICDSM